MLSGDTIAAVATAPGRGGVAIVRVSGADAFRIAEALTGRTPRAGRIGYAKIFDRRDDGQRALIDEGVVLAFAAPHSYTGEDVVEFQCHGGSVVPRRILRAAIGAGARLARRGEFTERAFLNGRLDYDQAESVLDLVDAKTERAADRALEGLQGRRHRDCQELYDLALAISVDLAHAIDIDEGELPEGFWTGQKTRIAELNARLALAIRRANEGKILREGALVVLAGPPNSGKSSLMNALLGENRAIVSATPGTTRDSIEEWLDVDGWPVRLTDTAGLRETGDAIEAEGVRRAEELMAKADVVLVLGDDAGAAARGIRIHAKCDLGRGEGLNVSAKTGEGLGELRAAIAAALEEEASGRAEESGESASLAALVEAQAILLARGGLSEGGESEMVLAADALREVAERLGTAIGATYSADLLDRLFSRFCIGK